MLLQHSGWLQPPAGSSPRPPAPQEPQAHLLACLRQNCQLAFKSATTVTCPSASSIGTVPLIFHSGAGWQMRSVTSASTVATSPRRAATARDGGPILAALPKPGEREECYESCRA